jgi:tRNA pseudouridine55 synthase
MIHGFLNIDKPAGMTSHDVVAKLRRLAGQKRVGHGGTLDPAATGVLPIALGEATRLLEYLVEGRKAYRAEVRLGISTTTDDAEGTIVEERVVPALDQNAIQRALQPFTGTIQQVPPMYSAIQIGGQRMYDLARRGETIDLPSRTVEIDAIEIASWQNPILTIDVRCGKGTYIRSLARDLGAALGCGAHLAALRRTAVGPLRIEDAMPLEALLEDEARRQGDTRQGEGETGRTGDTSNVFPARISPSRVSLSHILLPPATAVADWPHINVDDAATRRIRNGLPIDAAINGDHARAHNADGALLALLRRDDEHWKPFKVFNWS